MKKTDVIDLTLKIFGIKIFIGALLLIKDIINFSQIFYQSNNFMASLGGLIGYILAFAVLTAISYFLVIKTAVFVRLIVKNDDVIDLQPGDNYEELLSIALIITGLIIIIFRFPAFLAAAAALVRYLLGDMTNPTDFLIQQTGLLLLYAFGFVLIGNSRPFAKWILKKKNEEHS
ncbi:hypothetical protein [Saccharicrinis sp. FJH54]|uniref:hypothetical protein n=1 Tax=Saccharicrinis sp. FJH54 TaxID=3344665 RepID=UPI0035D47EA4